MKKKSFMVLLAVLLLVLLIPGAAKAASPVGDGHITFSSNSSFSVKAEKNWNGTLQYSVNGTTWITWTGAGVSAAESSGKYYLCFRGSGNTVITGSYASRWILTAESSVSCTGNAMTLLNYSAPGSVSMGKGCFFAMFRDWSLLTSAPSLPATALSEDCYAGMFRGCINLAAAPALPAATLSRCCYDSMFQDCRALKTAPALPAATLADFCYNAMFKGCTALNTAPSLPAKTMKTACYQEMFSGCAYLGNAPALPATALAQSCYQLMFCGCVRLTAVPELPAKNLEKACYSQMFSGCSGIKLYKNATEGAWSIPAGAAAAEDWNKSMFCGTDGDVGTEVVIGTVYHYANPLYPHIDSSNFPDETFRTYVKQFDLDGDGFLTAGELDAVREISVFNKGITSLQGLRFFTKLTKLECARNNLFKTGYFRKYRPDPALLRQQ